MNLFRTAFFVSSYYLDGGSGRAFRWAECNDFCPYLCRNNECDQLLVFRQNCFEDVSGKECL